MAKQTFTTGQVLTAAQMTSLQQTAMGGGEATAKVASYVLLAGDAGTTVIMNSGSATTITVNTALFAAGDTVNIQNIGAGICTVTAGTATVNTAGSLALNQYEGGVLYFRSTSAATFFDYVQTGSVSPLTTKGDLYGFSTLDARVPIGTNNQVLIADSAQSLGLKWGSAPSPSYTWTAYTPAITQGAAMTFTNRGSKYIVIDKLMTILTLVSFTSAGTANNVIYIDIPAASGYVNTYGATPVGGAAVYDASAALYYYGFTANSGAGTPNSFNLHSGIGIAGGVDAWGVTGSQVPVTLASGDQFYSCYNVQLT